MPHSPPAASHWGSLHTLHTLPAWAAAWWTWIWHLERQTSPAVGRRKLARQVKEKDTRLSENRLTCFHLWMKTIATFRQENNTVLPWVTHRDQVLGLVSQCWTEGRIGWIYHIFSNVGLYLSINQWNVLYSHKNTFTASNRALIGIANEKSAVFRLYLIKTSYLTLLE